MEWFVIYLRSNLFWGAEDIVSINRNMNVFRFGPAFPAAAMWRISLFCGLAESAVVPLNNSNANGDITVWSQGFYKSQELYIKLCIERIYFIIWFHSHSLFSIIPLYMTVAQRWKHWCKHTVDFPAVRFPFRHQNWIYTLELRWS